MEGGASAVTVVKGYNNCSDGGLSCTYINFPVTPREAVRLPHEKYPDYNSGAIHCTDNAARYKLSHKRKTQLILNKKACNSRWFDLPGRAIKYTILTDFK